MPTWKQHVTLAKKAGLNEAICRNISRLLDVQKPRKTLHNTSGVSIAYGLYGSEGARCAVHHIVTDAMSERAMQGLSPRNRILFNAMLKLQRY